MLFFFSLTSSIILSRSLRCSLFLPGKSRQGSTISIQYRQIYLRGASYAGVTTRRRVRCSRWASSQCYSTHHHVHAILCIWGSPRRSKPRQNRDKRKNLIFIHTCLTIYAKKKFKTIVDKALISIIEIMKIINTCCTAKKILLNIVKNYKFRVANCKFLFSNCDIEFKVTIVMKIWILNWS